MSEAIRKASRALEQAIVDEILSAMRANGITVTERTENAINDAITVTVSV